MSDGELIFNTKIDTSGIDDGVKELEGKNLSVEIPVMGKVDAESIKEDISKAMSSVDAPVVEVKADAAPVSEAVEKLQIPARSVKIRGEEGWQEYIYSEAGELLSKTPIEAPIQPTISEEDKAEWKAFRDEIEKKKLEKDIELKAKEEAYAERRKQIEAEKITVPVDADIKDAKQTVNGFDAGDKTIDVDADITDANEKMGWLERKLSGLSPAVATAVGTAVGTVVGRVGSAILGKIGDEIKDAITNNEEVSGALAKLETSVDDFFAGTIDALSPIVTTLAGALSSAVDFAAQGVTAIANLFAGPEKDELTKKIDEIKTDFSEYEKQVKASDEAFATNKSNVEARYALAQNYLTTLGALEQKEVKTDEDVAAMKAATEALVGLYPDLKANLDPVTGLFAKGSEAISGYIDSLADLALVNIYGERMEANATAIATAYDNLVPAQAALEDATAANAEALAKYNALSKAQELIASGQGATIDSTTAAYLLGYDAFQRYYDVQADGSLKVKSGYDALYVAGETVNTLTAAILAAYTAVSDTGAAVAEATSNVETYTNDIDRLTLEQNELIDTQEKVKSAMQGDDSPAEAARKARQLADENAVAKQKGEEFGAQMERQAQSSAQASAALAAQAEETNKLAAAEERNKQTNEALQGQLDQITAAQDRARASAEQQVKSIADGFNIIKSASKTSASDMAKGLESQTEYWTKYNEIMEKVKTAGYSDDVVNEVNTGTPEALAQAEALVAAAEKNGEAVTSMNTKYEEAKKARDAAIAEIATSTLAADTSYQAIIDKTNEMVAGLDQSALADTNIQTTLTAINDQLTAYQPTIQENADAINDTIDSIGSRTATESSATPSVTAASGSAASGADGAGKTIASLDALITQMQSYIPKAFAEGVNIEGGLGSGFASGTSLDTATSKAIRDAATNARTYVANNMSRFKAVGRNMIGGVATGVTEGTGLLESAVRSAIQKGLAAAKSEAEINSPSKLFAREVGTYIPKGISKGAIGEMPRMVRDISASFSRNYGLIGDGLRNGAAGTVINNNNTSNPQVTVNANVRDQTDVQSLALEIGYIMRRQEAGKGNG